MPFETYNQFVTDYVYQISFAIMGKVRYIAEPMCVYRAYVPGSWSSRHMENDVNAEKQILKGEHKLLEDLNRWSEFKYDNWFKMRFYRRLCFFYQKVENYKKAKEVYWKSVEFNGIVPFFNCLREYRFLWRKQHHII
ncbi:hypothetical protein HMPREF0653_00249 [Prevotella disiens JCM 6334 = ATCC 29426]|uniref:Uncharacterized protein n=4 Tax=Prevotella disiens TaxID=28130 RepID=A0A379DZX4_9BACT|nr:hypothetical protein [Prevotella disiens]ERJ80798.1 hypothetical protein HMPREF0653_00249 [Prevotella disiens JCM 6334 = ATCC 29426]SUB85582.1 Uncharacterised protein [Prevotella disiens]